MHFSRCCVEINLSGFDEKQLSKAEFIELVKNSETGEIPRFLKDSKCAY